MIIEKILKKLTPERIRKEVGAVEKVRLSREVKRLADEYKKIGDPDRNEYLWKWILRGTKIFTGNRVSRRFLPGLLEAKLLLFILDTFFDDIVDKYKFRNKKLLKEILKVPFQQDYIKFKELNRKEKRCVNFAINIWKRIEREIKKFPKYREFKDLLEYDISQFLNVIKYSYLVHQNNYLLNKTENWIYLPHSMQVVINTTLELMCMPKFNVKELGRVREVAWRAQRMSRIGNWISTWEREIEERDFTSGVFVYALDLSVITIDELHKGDKFKIIKKIRNSKVEEKLLKEWEQDYREINKLTKRIKSVNIREMLPALEKIIFYHLSSRGYK